MPTCYPSVIPTVVLEAMRLRPSSILDVGVGMGKFGLLMREYLEGWGHHRYCKDRWQVRIDGCEIFPQYIQPWHRELYDEIIVGDIRQQRFTKPYDLILIVDVIEHFPKPEGMALIRGLPYKNLIISTPNFKTRGIGRNKENPHQDHLSVWTAADFRTFKHQVLQKDRMLVVEVLK